LTWQAAFGLRISYFWDLIHIISGLVVIPVVIVHIAILIARYSGKANKAAASDLSLGVKRLIMVTSFLTIICIVVVALATYAYVPVVFANELPEHYSYEQGDSPFSPSLAMTSSGGAYDPVSMAESKSCGTEGCHKQIYEEWLPSAHRYSSMDLAFQAIQKAMAQNNGPASTRYCAGCHDPIALFSGSKNMYDEDLSSYGADEGVSCVVCHTISSTDLKGNANYVLDQPERYIFEFSEGTTTGFLRDFLIRSYPQHHKETFSKDLYKTPEYCAACHKQFIDEEINKVGWVQLQNQYDNWKASRWYHENDVTATISCRECHMYLVASTDPAAGDDIDYNRDSDDQKHRGHRFLGANQFMAGLLKLPGAEQHQELIEKWLKGDIDVPEIADKWTQAMVAPVEIMAPEKVTAGDDVAIKVSILNNKAGHDFPTGPIDIIQGWIELIVEDQEGSVVFHSGKLNDRHFIEGGSFVLKCEGIDQYGNLIDRHNLWEMVGARYKHALFPGFSDLAEYSFECPPTKPIKDGSGREFQIEVPVDYDGALKVTARLNYRKVNQFLVNFLFGEEAGLTTKVTEMSSDTALIWVEKSTI
jgi:hypothetical protein